MDAQIVVRFGIPPGMPAWLQSIAREGSRIPDHGSVVAARTARSPPTVGDILNASAIPSDRVTQALPTSWVLTVIIAEPAATFGLPSSTEPLPEKGGPSLVDSNDGVLGGAR